MIVPTKLKNHIGTIIDKEDCEFIVTDTHGCTDFEIYYYGELFFPVGIENSLIVDTESAPSLIVLKSCDSGEMITIFDNAIDGYNNMFCNQYSEKQTSDRQLSKLNVPSTKIKMNIEYSIDYDNERDDYDFDNNGQVCLTNGRTMSWKDVKCNGYTWICIYYLQDDEWIELVNEELA